MLTRKGGNFEYTNEGPEESRQLQAEGYAVLRDVFATEQLDELVRDVERVYRQYPPDRRGRGTEAERAPYRYEMFNRSAEAQAAIAHPRILSVIEPLLGEDCHVVANTCWRNPPGTGTPMGGPWHIDAGPHVPRPAGVAWDERIPYPIFAIGAHIFLKPCDLSSGPTGVIPKSHLSGAAPPGDRPFDGQLTCNGKGVVPLPAHAGDVALFASDVWHRRLPTLENDRGRFFLQCHYGRRDIAQRVRPTHEVNFVSREALERCRTPRERTLLGLHPELYYDG